MLKFRDQRANEGTHSTSSGQAGIRVNGFTLTEIMLAVSIFSIISTIVAGLYIQSFRESARANNQNQVYEDARFILQQIGNEIRDGAIDYDEYYNQNVVKNTSAAVEKGKKLNKDSNDNTNYGQNFGRYYSSFFNPGTIFNSTTNQVEDDGLGFQCNSPDPDGNIRRNKNDCVPLRRTIDRNTGSNPFSGKYNTDPIPEENAFCGYISYETGINPAPAMVGDLNATTHVCDNTSHPQSELYLISADSSQKTILARERTGNHDQNIWALSILRLKGDDTDNDGIPDAFKCDNINQFNCMATGDLPRLDSKDDQNNDVFGDLNEGNVSTDSKETGFSNDFVPISPLSVNVSDLKFYISPSDDPHYAFAEESSANQQPRVTIVLTVEPIGSNTSGIPPVTLVETVSTRMLTPIKAPIAVWEG